MNRTSAVYLETRGGIAELVLNRPKKLVTSSFELDFEEHFATYLKYQEECLRSPDHKSAMADYRCRKK